MNVFKKLISLGEATKIIDQHIPKKVLAVEELPLLEAHNRVLAQDVIAELNIPPFSRSTVDGYAVKSKDTFEAEENKPVKLRICGIVSAGKSPKTKVREGTAAEIATGAPMPDGSDAVVMFEDTEKKANSLYVHTSVAKNENVMKAGSDIRKGEKVLKMGQVLTSKQIGVLAAIGLAKARVHATPHVAVLSTGAEVSEPGKKLPPAKIYDINAYSLSAAILESGGKPVYLGVFPDDLLQIQKALKKALATADLIVTSGGVSVGPKDLLPKALDSLGKPGVIVCGIAIKPGKPVTIAVVDGKMIFSMPGHPTSASLMFHLLVRPVIMKLAGRNIMPPQEVKAVAGMRMFQAKGRRTFVMVKLKRKKPNRLVAEPVATGLSGAITTFAKADGFVEITENQQFISEGEQITVQLFREHDGASY